jgi:hypothetical protein
MPWQKLAKYLYGVWPGGKTRTGMTVCQFADHWQHGDVRSSCCRSLIIPFCTATPPFFKAGCEGNLGHVRIETKLRNGNHAPAAWWWWMMMMMTVTRLTVNSTYLNRHVRSRWMTAIGNSGARDGEDTADIISTIVLSSLAIQTPQN